MNKKQGFFLAIILGVFSVWLFGKKAALAEVMVVETEIGDLPPISQPGSSGDRPLKGITMGEALQHPAKPGGPFQDIEINERHVIQINQTLRKVIEENEKLMTQNKDLDLQLRNLRGQRNLETNRLNTVTVERDAYKTQNEKVLQLNQKYENDILSLKADLQNKEKELSETETKMDVLPPQPQGADKEDAPREDLPESAEAPKTQRDGWDVLAMMDHVQRKNEVIMKDEARVHYNMGNVFFKQGDYQKAAHEFQKAVQLYPQDANFHFNLAFVSGEYLSDHATALRHYQWYLYFAPEADDVRLVRERILEAELYLKSQIDSPLEKDAIRSNREVVDRMMVP
jgi:tetratricopeptide (TPR) repeat protein